MKITEKSGMLLIATLLLSGRIVLRPKEVQRLGSSVSKELYTPIHPGSLTPHPISAVFLFKVRMLLAIALYIP